MYCHAKMDSSSFIGSLLFLSQRGRPGRFGCDAGRLFQRYPPAGKVRVVHSFPDIRVQVVSAFPDLRVQTVNYFPDNIGQWQFVDYGEDFTIQFVESFPDIRIQFVNSFPGVP